MVLDQVSSGGGVLGGDGGAVWLSFLLAVDARGAQWVGADQIRVELFGFVAQQTFHAEFQNSFQADVSEPSVPQKEQFLVDGQVLIAGKGQRP